MVAHLRGLLTPYHRRSSVLREELVLEALMREQTAQFLQNMALSSAAALGNPMLKAPQDMMKSVSTRIEQAYDMAAQRWKSMSRYKLEGFLRDRDAFGDIVGAYKKALSMNVFEKLEQIIKDKDQ